MLVLCTNLIGSAISEGVKDKFIVGNGCPWSEHLGGWEEDACVPHCDGGGCPQEVTFQVSVHV